MYEPTTLPFPHELQRNGALKRSPARFAGDVAVMSENDHTDPVRLAELMRLAADATRRAAPGPAKRYARALGVSPSRASRHLSGDDPYTPAVKLLSAVEALASGQYTSALPLLMEAFAVALETLNRRATPDLENHLRELLRRRVEKKAALDAARVDEFERGAVYGGEESDKAAISVAEIDVEIVGVRRILRERAGREG